MQTASRRTTHSQAIILQHADALLEGQAQRLGQKLQGLEGMHLIDHAQLPGCTALRQGKDMKRVGKNGLLKQARVDGQCFVAFLVATSQGPPAPEQACLACRGIDHAPQDDFRPLKM